MIEGHELGSSGIRPDWVILGVELRQATWPREWARGWRYMAVGSSEISQADLRREAMFDPYHYLRAEPFSFRPPEVRTTLTCRLGSYTLAFGRTYGEALARLMGDWSPDAHPDPQGLPAAPRELGDGR